MYCRMFKCSCSLCLRKSNDFFFFSIFLFNLQISIDNGEIFSQRLGLIKWLKIVFIKDLYLFLCIELRTTSLISLYLLIFFLIIIFLLFKNTYKNYVLKNWLTNPSINKMASNILIHPKLHIAYRVLFHFLLQFYLFYLLKQI